MKRERILCQKGHKSLNRNCLDIKEKFQEVKEESNSLGHISLIYHFFFPWSGRGLGPVDLAFWLFWPSRSPQDSHLLRVGEMSHFTCLILHGQFYLSHFTWHISHETCHILHVTFYMSHFTCHILHVTFYIANFTSSIWLYRCWASTLGLICNQICRKLQL